MWEFQNKTFNLTKWSTNPNYLFLNYTYLDGDGREIGSAIWISEINLHELKMFGLDVILLEKPKLTDFERELLEKAFHFSATTPLFVIRNKNNTLCVHSCTPRKKESYWEDPSECVRVFLNESLFSFITWESGKIWTREELLNLEIYSK